MVEHKVAKKAKKTYDLHMGEATYIEQLRAIRDRINEELQEVSWEEWESQARQKALRDPRLARLIAQAEATQPQSGDRGE